MKLSHWYKIHIELLLDGEWKVIHKITFKWEDFNDNFQRFICKQLEGLYGMDRMVIYYDNEKNLKEMREIEESRNNGSKTTKD